MRLIAWNCKGALWRKLPRLDRPDVLVAPEAEDLAGLGDALSEPPAGTRLWVGASARKGLGVLAFGDYSVEVHPAYEPRHKWILPVKVSGPQPFLLFAVWTIPSEDLGYYAQPAIEAAHTYRRLLRAKNVVWAGDFNSNVALDRKQKRYRFSHFLEQMTGYGLHSVYHHLRRCEHGGEPENTFYLHHNAAKGFHIDFVFASPSLLSQASRVEVGAHADWAKLSDHMPVVCSFGDAGNVSGDSRAQF